MFEEFPTFSFGDYSMRAINPAKDAELFFKYISQREVNDFIGDDSVPKTLEEAHRELSYWSSLFNLRRSYFWAVTNEKDEIIGTVGFNNISKQHLRGEISYDLDKNYWGRGIMSNSVFHVIHFSFENLGLVRIQATAGQHNERSIKLLDNLGFKREGSLAKYERLKGKHYDFYMYAITKNI